MIKQILELVDTPYHMKPSNFGHMISHGQEAYPVSLKQSKLLKMTVLERKTYRQSLVSSVNSLKSFSFFFYNFSEVIALSALDMLHTEILMFDGNAIIFLKLHCHCE